ncbi:MAG: GAF domain-containing protein [Polaromonas sp.]|nr:GAF domain-containing protein [Polaromonas sp.]
MTQKTEAEETRLAALKSLLVMDSPEEQAYDDITRLAASVCGTPIALISLVDDKRQWFKARVGLAARETPRDMAFCAHAIPSPNDVLIVQDAQSDTRFAANPLVTGDPNIRFYAGAPLVTKSNQVLGTLCVIDRVPRTLDGEQLETLKFMAAQVISMLEAKAGSQEPIALAVDKSTSARLGQLRKAIAEERSSSPAGSDTLRLLTERMRGYEKGSNLAPSLSEFIEWRNMVELEKARSRFLQGRSASDKNT